jgi:hypothetical protein
VAQLIRIVRAPALPNAQTPLRVVCLVLAMGAGTTAPNPFDLVVGVALVVLALSLGVSPTKGST